MTVLVTGADGFVGKHLVRALEGEGTRVAVVPGSGAGAVDVRDEPALRSRVEEAKPDAVVHLAGMSSVARSHESPGLAFDVNAVGTANLLAAVRAVAPGARVLFVSSGEVYGRSPGASANEEAPLVPRSPYAAAKLAAEIACAQFHRSYGLDVVCARPFNHLGAGQAEHFAVPSFAKQLAAVRGSAGAVVRTGDLGAVRDFSHVSDVVAAYLLLLSKAPSGSTFNVSSGVGRSIRSLLDSMLLIAGVTAHVEIDPERIRPAEIPSLVGDATRLRALGWAPRFDAEHALREVLAEHGALAPATRP